VQWATDLVREFEKNPRLPKYTLMRPLPAPSPTTGMLGISRTISAARRPTLDHPFRLVPDEL
jgi:hypothetical protein